jgi:hypothetical protein
VNVGIETVVVYEITVDTTYVVMFVKVNTKVRLYPPAYGIMVEVQVVTIMFIGPTAGAFAGTRTTSPARITHVMMMALIASCLFKSVLSSVGFDVGYNPEAPSIPIC